jgi:2'-5' RNA ligase
MREDLDAASQSFKSDRQLKKELRGPYEQQVKPIADRWAKRKAEGASQEELTSIAKEYTEKWDTLKPQLEQDARKAYVDQYHHWYKANAGKYGFEYSFTPAQKKTRKSDTMDQIDEIEKSSGEVVLDQKMHDDVQGIVNDILSEYPRDLTQTNTAKSIEDGRAVLFIGLHIANAEPLAIKGGENHEDFHVTLAYGHFDKGDRDDEDIERCVSYAVDQVKVGIPDTIKFDAMGRFPASKSSDGKDVIYAQVAAGQLEESHDYLLSILKEKGIELEDTFPEYKPHMTLAYIEPGAEFELKKLDASGTVTKVMIGHGWESTHENNYTIAKMDDDKRLVFGWASISFTADGEQLEDLQHDIIDPEDLEEAVYEYVLHFRDTGEEHRPHLRKKGKLVESCVFTAEKQKAMGLPEGILPVGWWIGFKIEDDEAWEKVKNGTYRMFSIEGKAQRVPVEKAAPAEIAPTVTKAGPERFDHIQEFDFP